MAVKTNITINIVEPGSDVPVPDTGLFTHGIGGTETTIIVSAALVTVLVILSIILTTYMYRKHKKQGRTTKLVHIIDQTKAVVKSKKRVTIGLTALALLASIGTLTALLSSTNKNNTNAIEDEEGLTINAESKELTIEVKDQPVFAVLPVEVTVEEATEAGYTLTASTNSTDLVSTTDSSKVIPMITLPEAGGELSPLTDNTYGLALGEEPTTKDEAVYTALSTDLSNPTILKAIDDYSSTPANDTTTIYYGFYITPDMPYGTYTGGEVEYKATQNRTDLATVIYNGNGLYFNKDEREAANKVRYEITTSNYTNKYSHMTNLNHAGEVVDDSYSYRMYPVDSEGTFVYEFPGADKVRVNIVKTDNDGCPNDQNDYFTFWAGNYPNYTAKNYGITNPVLAFGNTTGKYVFGDYNNVQTDIDGDAVTFAYSTGPGGGSRGCHSGYGYYAILTGYDTSGNAVHLPGNNLISGKYLEPTQDLPYVFLGWSEDKDATVAAYKSTEDIELELLLDEGKVTNLYAVWQHATNISFDGNGSDGGMGMLNKLIGAGKSISLCNYDDRSHMTAYTKTGYSFAGWNTKADGTGKSYSSCESFIASADQSLELTLYAQWAPATTIVYDGNGGEGNGPTQIIRAGETSSIYGNQGYFNMNGYIFSHWNTKPDGSGETYYGGDQFTASDQSTTITLYAQWINGAILDTGATVNAKLKRLAGNSSASYSTLNTNVTTIVRASTLPVDFAPTNDNIISINGSTTPVYAWYGADTTTIYYYTESDGIIMNPDSSNMFRDLRKLSDATSIADWDTTYVTKMSFMFYYAGYNATTFSLDLSSWDTSNVTNMSYMFQGAGRNATTWSIGDLSSWDTSKVTDMNWMFSSAGYNATTFSLDLSSWDTSNVTNMNTMFFFAGATSTTWSIGDLSSWDTSNVTNMGSMFLVAGSNAITWSIGDLSSWDTSNVTDMSQMFSSAGSNATTWSIGDLSSWDTSNVTDMNCMFLSAGRNATTFSLDLSSWDTSKVTDMNNMFNSAGYNATTFSLDLSSWDNSNVTKMRSMFVSAGRNATTFSLDLSSWDTSNVTIMDDMFSSAGYNATTFSLDLSSWDTSKVRSMNNMFVSAGYNATTFSLDLSSWDTSNVTNMGSMFNSAGSNATTWLVIIPPKTGDIDNTTSSFYGKNSSFYVKSPYNRFFTLAAQANSNATNTTGSLNSVNNAEVPNQDNSSGNRSAYATEDTESTENVDDTSSDTTSTPSRQEPLGEHQRSTIASTEDTSIAIPILIAVSITLGTSALVLLAYKSRRREDE